MTLLVALKGKDGLVLAADSRGTFGDPRGVTAQNDTMQKAHILSEHVAVLAAGSGEVGALIIDISKKEIKQNNIDSATSVMEKFRDIVRKQYNEWFPTVPPIQSAALMQSGQVAVRPGLEFLIGGYEKDNTSRLYGLSSMTDFSPMLHDYGFAIKGIAQYALYLLNRLYSKDMTLRSAIELAAYCISETATQDGKVGGAVQIAEITTKNGFKAYTKEEVEGITEENKKQSQSLQGLFFKN